MGLVVIGIKDRVTGAPVWLLRQMAAAMARMRWATRMATPA